MIFTGHRPPHRYARAYSGKYVFTEHDPANPWPRYDKMRERWRQEEVVRSIDKEIAKPLSSLWENARWIMADPMCEPNKVIGIPRKSISEMNAADVDDWRLKYADQTRSDLLALTREQLADMLFPKSRLARLRAWWKERGMWYVATVLALILLCAPLIIALIFAVTKCIQ